MIRIIFVILIALLCLGGIPTSIAQQPVPDLSEGIATIEWNPDGSTVAIATYLSGVWLYANGTFYSVIPENILINDITWSPDGKSLAVLKHNFGYTTATIEIWDVSSPESPVFLRSFDDEGMKGEDFEDLDWNPTSNLIAVSGVGIRIWDTDTGTLVHTFQSGEYATFVSWSPDGVTVMTSSHGHIRLWNTRTGYLQQELDLDAYFYTWGNDSQHIAVTQGFEVHIVDLTQPDSPSIILTGSNSNTMLEWNGSTLAGSIGRGFQIWDVPSQQLLTTLHNLDSNVVGLSPDGSRVAFAKANALARQIVNKPDIPNVPYLGDLIAECISDSGIQTSLIARIEAGQWGALINEVKALESAQITPECAAEIVEMAQYFIENPPPE